MAHINDIRMKVNLDTREAMEKARELQRVVCRGFDAFQPAPVKFRWLALIFLIAAVPLAIFGKPLTGLVAVVAAYVAGKVAASYFTHRL